MNDPDNQIDQLLRGHLARQLDPHLGRFEKAFAAELRKDETIRRRFSIRYWAAAAVLLLCSSLAATLFIHNLLKRRAPQNPTVQHVAENSEPQPLMPITQTVDWHVIDDGTVALNGDIPVRRVRQQIVERTKWYDPNRKTTFELSVPTEQVMLISN
jgi:hypothetical protein